MVSILFFEMVDVNCPKCGKEMEHGYLHLYTTGIFNAEWTRKKVVPSMTPEYIEWETISRRSPPGQIEGFRCHDDKIIVFSYESWQI